MYEGSQLCKYDHIPDGTEALTKVRYKHPGELATLNNEGEEIKALFAAKAEGIAPGEVCCFL